MAFDFLRNLFGNKKGTPQSTSPNPAVVEEAQPVTDPTELAMIEATWLTLASTNVDKVRYLYEDHIAEVQFHNGGVYSYYEVPPATFRGLVDSDSPGRYIWTHYRNIFEYTRWVKGNRQTPYVHRGRVVRAANELLTDEERQAYREPAPFRSQTGKKWD